MQVIRIILTLGEQGWDAVSPDLEGFALNAPTFMDAVAKLPAALNTHCRQPVEFKVADVRMSGPTWPAN